jgi:membrane-associated phospholipid phosphatase
MSPFVRLWVCALAFACLGVPAEAQVVVTPDPVGDALQYLLPLGAAGLALYHDDVPGLKQLGITLVVSQGTTEVIKHVANQPRPDGTGYGFPSGHTSIVFAAAGYVHRRYGPWEAVPFYALATVTGWERVHHNHHYTSQVVGGAAIGVASAFFFTDPLPDGGRLSLGMRAGGPWLAYQRSW